MKGLDNLIKRKLLSNKKISEESLITRKFTILRKVDKKRSKLKNRIKPSKSDPILKEIDVLKHFKKVCPCSC